ncbi:MAG TPA: acylphosphatase [Noviherbaspirillum sp.]
MAKHLRITGLVQGVGYRASFEDQARALRLSGWVRNRADGSVEAVVRGDTESLETIVAWSKRGPRAARVSQVIVTDMDDASVEAGRFEVLPTQ